jgi:hypothetical protein
VHRLRDELDRAPGASDRRVRAARERASREVDNRARRARETLEQLRHETASAAKTHKKAEQDKGERAVSTTDPEARLMVFADQRVAPGYNVQLAADGWFVVGVDVTARRNDLDLAGPMVDQLAQRYKQTPSRLIVDSRIATRDEIVALSNHPQGGVDVYAPVPEDNETVKAESRRKRIRRQSKDPRRSKPGEPA